MDKKNNRSTFGIIALIAAIGAFTLPKILVTFPVIVGLLFALIGLFVDARKWPSLFSIVLIGLFFYFEAKNIIQTDMDSRKRFEVSYKVTGKKFKVTYRNSTGGTNFVEGDDYWSSNESFRKGDFAYVSAQNIEGSTYVDVAIYIDGKLVENSHSFGEYSIATVSTYP